MARFMTRTINAPAGRVLEAVLSAAGRIGLEIVNVDSRNGEARLRRPLRRAGNSRRLFVAVTDNGFGGSTLHLSWGDDFPGRNADRRTAIQLWRVAVGLLS